MLRMLAATPNHCLDTILHADNRSPAAHPALLPLSQFRGKISTISKSLPLDNVRISVKKDAAGAQVAGISGRFNGSLLELIETGTRTGRRCRTRRSGLRSAMKEPRLPQRCGKYG